MDVVLVLVTIVGTFGAVGWATVAAGSRGGRAWSPPAVTGQQAASRVRRLVAVTRSGVASSHGADAAPAVDPTPRAAGDDQATEAPPAPSSPAAERPEAVGGATRPSRPASVVDVSPPTPIRPAERMGTPEPAEPAEPADPAPRDDLARLVEQQTEAMARLAERQAEEAARLAERIARRDAEFVERLDGLAEDAAAGRDEARASRVSSETRFEAALERLRSELLAGWSAREAALADRDEQRARLRLGERQAPAAAELYARLARLEAAVAAVTNPILLPGEPYAPPTEFSDDALVWENWKDVGERAFAFADVFNTQRLLLGPPVRDEVAAFVTELRGLLTRSVYPNLRPDPTPDQVAALRAALERLAADVPRVREALAGEYRAAIEGTIAS